MFQKEGDTTISTTVQLPPTQQTQDNKRQQKIQHKLSKDEEICHDTTTLGNLVVPSVGIGTISWSSRSLTTLENLELQTLVKEAYHSNTGLFDTAERYGSHAKTALGLGWGETETLLQQFLQRAKMTSSITKKKDESSDTFGGDGDSVINRGQLRPVVATKFTPSPWRTTVESVVAACEQSRQRLGVDQIDLYQLHMPDIVQPLRFLGMGAPKDEMYWEGLAECYKRGLVKNVGVSNYGPTLVTKCQDHLAKHGVPLASNQIAYSLIGRHNGAQETLDKCTELGIKTLAYYPFAMGLLTGKYSPDSANSINSDTVVTSLTASQKTALELRDLNAYAKGNGKSIPPGGITPLLHTMSDIALAHRKTVAQVALNYIVCKGAIPIPGARTVAQWRDNVGAMGWRLEEEEVRRLEEVADELGFAFEGAGFKRTSEKFVGYGVEKWSLE